MVKSSERRKQQKAKRNEKEDLQEQLRAFLLQKIREELLSRQGANVEEEEDDGKTEKKLLYIFLAIVSAFFSLCVLAIAFPPGPNKPVKVPSNKPKKSEQLKFTSDLHCYQPDFSWELLRSFKDILLEIETVTISELETDEELEKQEILLAGFNGQLITLARTGCFDFKGYPESKVFVIGNLFGRVQVESLHSQFILQVIESERVPLKNFKVKSFSKWIKQMLQLKTDELTRETTSSIYLYFENMFILGCINFGTVGVRRLHQPNLPLELCGLLLPYVFSFVLLSYSISSCILATLVFVFLLCVAMLAISQESNWRRCAFLLMPLATLLQFGWLGFATFVSNWLMSISIQSVFKKRDLNDQ